MAPILQTLLIGMGIVGFLFSIPAAITCWLRHTGLLDAISREPGTMSSPLVCGAIAAAGFIWMRVTQRKESRRSPGYFSEDGGPDGGGDGGASD